ncbi:ketoacyl-ACP synthase III [Candidatus Roizmanbacteria bacterium]|nr:ketoacyl-ACP synthase III [Candidatus Roizmanbacteria bacterium]
MSRERIPAITAFGNAVGQKDIFNEDIDGLLGRRIGYTDRVMSMVGAGMKHRYWVTVENNEALQATSDLASEALLRALEMGGYNKNHLTRIIVATSSPDYLAVSTAAMVQHKLGLPTSIQAYDLAAGCTGWLQGLNDAFANLTSPLGRKGLQAVIGAEVISPILSKKKPNTYLLFGDAAGATIVDLVEPDEGAPTNIAFVPGADGSLAEKLAVMGGGSKFPASQYTVDNNMHSLDMEGGIIKDNAIMRMVEVTKKALEESGVPIEEVALFIPHQANLSIIQATAEELKVPMEKVMVTIDKYGNTSSASIPTALKEAWDTQRIERNDIMAMATFGAGLEYIAAVLPMVGLPKEK